MQHFIRSKVATLVVTALMALGSGAAVAGDGEGKVAGTRVSLIGTVTAVDAANRAVTIKNAQGLERSYSVDPSVQNFENVKVGDRVRLDYLVAVAVALRKNGDGIREKVEAEAEGQAPAGSKPGVAAGRRTTWVADVVSVDRKRQTVRLKGPEGRVADVQVKDKARLSEVKAGDQVVAVLFEAVAVGVAPAPKTGTAAAAAK